MPQLRFTRDKRGYENTYVMHSVRRRGKARQHVLYWFRTPPNIRVGRAALDEEAIRAIEECNPGIAFDWGKILEGQPAPAPVEPVERRRRSRDSGMQGPSSRAPHVSRPEEEHPTGAPSFDEPPAAREIAAATPVEQVPMPDGVAPDTAEAPEIEPPALVPVTVYHGGADVLVTQGADEPRVPPVEARLGSEQLSRVRARYAEILARITQRVGSDPVRLEEMRRAAELLNPDAWVTEEEIASALQHFDARLGEIRRALGIKRRRRSRRGGRRRQLAKLTPDGGSAPAEVSGGAEAASNGEEDPIE